MSFRWFMNLTQWMIGSVVNINAYYIASMFLFYKLS